MDTILVTGGTGFIGSHLVARLAKQGKHIRVLVLPKPLDWVEAENEEFIKRLGVETVSGDLRDVESLQRAMQGVEVVYHLASISRPMAISDRAYYEINVRGTENLLKIAKEHSVKRFILVSTVSILGVSPDGHPLSEDEYQYDNLSYGLTKREGERIALYYCYKHKVPLVVIRPSLVYGPRCLARLIMFKFVKLRLFPLFNNGRSKMEFSFVENIVQALLLAETNDNAIGEVFNITDGKSYRIGEILEVIADELGVRRPMLNIPVSVGFCGGIVMEVFCKLVGTHPPFSRKTAEWMSRDSNVYDNKKAKDMLGYSPEVGLREGVKKTILWYKGKGLL